MNQDLLLCNNVDEDERWACVRAVKLNESPFENTFIPLTYVYLFLKIVATPILFYGFYLAAFCSSHLTSNILKYHVLNFQIISAFWDILCFFITEPHGFFPLIAGDFRGIAYKWFHIHPFICVIALVVSASLLPAAIFQTLFQKIQILLSPGHPFKLKRKTFVLILVFMYHLCLCIHLPFAYFLFINTQQAKGKLVMQYPFISDFLNQPQMLAMTYRDDWIANAWVTTIFWLGMIYMIGAITIALASWLYVNNRNGSQRTKKLEKKLLMILYFQTFSPFFIILPAFSTIYVIVYFRIWFCQDLIDFVIALVSTYGTWSTITMILVSDSYRKMTFDFLSTGRPPRPQYNFRVHHLHGHSTVAAIGSERFRHFSISVSKVV
ncbi:unnamed protein product, partial [Mesorhabditis belari]|uniref:Uncharacterized protein n=1 Tax=Mesorhabditis belari TaxID=2138241 RepID=A0AAF3EBS0_9BILA